MSGAKPAANRDGLHVGIPDKPLDDAALAIGRFIMDGVFWPRTNGKIPPEHWNCRALRDTDWKQFKEWERLTLQLRSMQDDYHGGW